MLPPALEIYVVWHPDDGEGKEIADYLVNHFHGSPCAGLIGGAIEVYTRSESWNSQSLNRDLGAPRPLSCSRPLPYNLPSAQMTAIVPVVGTRLARACEDESSDWRNYIQALQEAVFKSSKNEAQDCVRLFPIRLSGTIDGWLTGHMGGMQWLDWVSSKDLSTLCRELSQAFAQFIKSNNDPKPRKDFVNNPLTVFISHTKQHSLDEKPDYVDALITSIQEIIINDTRLSTFFAPRDIHLGSYWGDKLKSSAAEYLMLAVRTDLYAGREWCQREFLIAKQFGTPIVVLNAIHQSKERGSFLMDHVPIVGYDDCDTKKRQHSIKKALNLLIDESLRKVVWDLHGEKLKSQEIDWLSFHAPEPTTVIQWLSKNSERVKEDRRIVVMHPDPPLGPEENNIIKQLFEVAETKASINIVTPRTYSSSRKGELVSSTPDVLAGMRVGISVSDSEDLRRLGLSKVHAEMAVGEIARAVLNAGGTLVYGGRVKPSGFTQYLMHEVHRYGRDSNALVLCLAAPEYQKLTWDELDSIDRELGTKGKIICLDEDGDEREIKDILNSKQVKGELIENDLTAQAYSSLRVFMGKNTDARVLLGGNLGSFAGRMPGIIEEAIIAVENKQPLFVSAGFGGAAALVAQKLEIDDLSWGSQDFPKQPEDQRKAELVKRSLEKLDRAATTSEWDSSCAGLDPGSLRQLSASHRASEIAALVVTGLSGVCR